MFKRLLPPNNRVLPENKLDFDELREKNEYEERKAFHQPYIDGPNIVQNYFSDTQPRNKPNREKIQPKSNMNKSSGNSSKNSEKGL